MTIKQHFPAPEIDDFHLNDAALADYFGVYTTGLNATYRFSVEKGVLKKRTNWGPTMDLEPVVPNEFLAYGGAATLAFRRDGNGRVSGFSLFTWAARNVSFEKTN